MPYCRLVKKMCLSALCKTDLTILVDAVVKTKKRTYNTSQGFRLQLGEKYIQLELVQCAIALHEEHKEKPGHTTVFTLSITSLRLASNHLIGR